MDENEKMACPRCGKILDSGEVDQHVCEMDVSSTEAVAADQLPVQIEDHPRIVQCPNCQIAIDVTHFDPLENVQCYSCNRNFTLLKTFENFTLLRAYDTGWHNAIYLGRREPTGETAIVKVLSSHVLSQPDAVQAFYQEQEQMRSGFLEPYSSQFQAGQFCGFQYFVIPLDADLTEEQILSSAGVVPAEAEVPVHAISINRAVQCSSCQSSIDVTSFNPLDTIRCPQCTDTFELMRNIGDYRIDYRLNAGGTSLLFLAHNSQIKKDLALKVLSASEMQHGPEVVRQFVLECELTRKLVHPNLIQVYDHGNLHGFYYMALELVEGLSLDDILKAIQEQAATIPQSDLARDQWGDYGGGGSSGRDRYKEALPELVALEMILQSAAGLGVAHQNQLVHGDVKPANIMVTYEGIVKVLDFGLVQFANADKVFSDGEPHPIYGTPIYVPPERVRGEPEDFRSDIYGLGATLYHLLRGVPPFVGKTATEIAVKQVTAPLVSFKAYAPWVSDTTCRIVEKSLKKSVGDRYSSHVEFIADLTLAKNQVLNSMPVKITDGRTLLKTFMRSLPRRTSSRAWKRAETTALRTYKYVTKAISHYSHSKLGIKVRRAAPPTEQFPPH